MPAEAYFSTDVEADGKIPGPYSMSSIGVALCGYRTKSGLIVRTPIDAAQPTFYAELKPISDRFDPEAAAVSKLRREDLIRNGQDPAAAMTAHNTMVSQTCEALGEQIGETVRPVLACYPLGYDVIWVQWYSIYFTGQSVYGHSTHWDAKSVFAEKAKRGIVGATKRNMPKHLLGKGPHTHNALDDAIEQGEMIINIMEWDGA